MIVARTPVLWFAIVPLLVASCSPQNPAELASSEVPDDLVLAKNIESLVEGTSVDGRPLYTYTDLKDVNIIGKFPIVDQRSYQVFAEFSCKTSHDEEGDAFLRSSIDSITLKRLDNYKWVIRYDVDGSYWWKLIEG